MDVGLNQRAFNFSKYQKKINFQRFQQSLKNTMEDEVNMRKAYVLDSDIENCYEDNVFLAVKARPGTRLEVPVVNNNVSNHINLNPYAVTVPLN